MSKIKIYCTDHKTIYIKRKGAGVQPPPVIAPPGCTAICPIICDIIVDEVDSEDTPDEGDTDKQKKDKKDKRLSKLQKKVDKEEWDDKEEYISTLQAVAKEKLEK